MKVPNVNHQEYGAVGDPELSSGGQVFGTQPALDAKSPIGNGVGTVGYHGGESTIIATKSADMTNSDTSLNINYDPTNRSNKKFKGGSQDTGTMYSDQK